ncbi:MAG: cytochrome c1 [Gammaproteobacteria bacterium]|nr:cytochrome c1 [Gammaproteobacteria bacterium]
MKRKLLVLVLAFFPVTGFSAGAGGAALDYVEVSLDDKVSLQNGAKLFVNYCLSCHSAKYMRYNRMAQDLEIPEALVKEQMILPGGKIGDTMNTTMSKEDAEEWFGVAPPDLTLIGKLYTPKWLYTYLRSFYRDESTASGWNNTVFPNVAMPHVMHELQGIQKANITTRVDEEGHAQQVTELEMVKAGSMSTEEFDRSMRDLTNFLYYMAEPARMVRIKYGVWTMSFLLVLGILAFLLKKEYWRDVH